MGGISSRALIRFINGLFGSNHPLDSEPAPPALALGVVIVGKRLDELYGMS
jgi:hypothetical protein